MTTNDHPQGRGPIRFAHDTQNVTESLMLDPVGALHMKLRTWFQMGFAQGQMHSIIPEFHRLQIEHWIWKRSRQIMNDRDKLALDFGVITRRAWQDNHYKTAGVSGNEDHRIDLCHTSALSDQHASAYDLVICSEVLEHVEDPHAAMRTLTRLLRPGGTLLVTSPFLWPDHATEDYPDYWRFTEGAWRLLVRHAGLTLMGDVVPTMWTYDGGHLYELLRRIEGFGFGPLVEGQTGYMVEARKDSATGGEA